MVKFCSNCGNQLNDESKFCAKCGTRVDDVGGQPGTQQNVNAGVFCGKCGALVPLGNTVCTSCGASLNQDSHKIAIVLGYICAFLFHIVGIIFGIYLLTRDNPDVKKHGAIIIAISVVMVVVSFFIITYVAYVGSMSRYSYYYY